MIIKRITPSHIPLFIEERNLQILDSEKCMGLYIDKHLYIASHTKTGRKNHPTN